MVADEPTEGRCNVRVIDKIGLDVECTVNDTELVLTDHLFDIARLVGPHGGVVDADADYGSVQKFLWEDYELHDVGVIDDSVGEDSPVSRLQNIVGETNFVDVIADEEQSAPDTTVDLTHEAPPVWFDISAIVDNVTNRTSVTQGFCERYQLNEEGEDHCYVHRGNGGPPTGNTNAMDHGLYAQRSNFYSALDDEDKQYVEALVDSWIDIAPFDRDTPAMVDTLYQCAIDQLRAWRGQDEYLDESGGIEGLVKTQDVEIDGEMVELEDEHPVNMAYSRLKDDVRKQLKDIGVYDSPEAQQAEATESIARKLSGLTDE